MKITKVLLVLLVLATACSNDTKETLNGFKFKLAKNGEGEPANQNQVIVFKPRHPLPAPSSGRDA
jgi:hypothetical protein